MSWLLETRGSGLELLLEFMPVSVRVGPASNLGVPLLSSDLVAELSDELGGPVLEASWPGTAALAGVLRGARHADSILVVTIPSSLRAAAPDALARVGGLIVDIAADTGHDRPLVLASTGWPLGSPADGPADEALREIFQAVEAGFTSFGFVAAPLEDAARRVWRILEAMEALGVGIELEFEPHEDSEPFLNAVARAGLSVAAVRGAGEVRERCGGLPVVDPVVDAVPTDGICRLAIDGFVVQSVVRALREEGPQRLAEDARTVGPGRALTHHANEIDGCDDVTLDRVEAFAYSAVIEAAERLGASGTATELQDGLIASHETEGAPGDPVVDDR